MDVSLCLWISRLEASIITRSNTPRPYPFQPPWNRLSMLWQQCLQQLEQEVPDHEINTWLRALHAVEKRQALYLLAPNTIVLQQVHEQYLPRILFHARILSGDNEFDVLLQIGSSTPSKPPHCCSMWSKPTASTHKHRSRLTTVATMAMRLPHSPPPRPRRSVNALPMRSTRA